MKAEKAEFCIGGFSAVMTKAQADRWNSGQVTDRDLRTVKVGLPDEYMQPSYLRDGEIIIGTPRLVKSSRQITLARATNARLSPETAAAMDGMPAFRCGDWR